MVTSEKDRLTTLLKEERRSRNDAEKLSASTIASVETQVVELQGKLADCAAGVGPDAEEHVKLINECQRYRSAAEKSNLENATISAR